MYGFKAFAFDGKRTAGKALDTLEDYAPAYMWIDDVATVSKSKHGPMRVHSTWAQDDSNVGVGTGLGAMTGAMVGLFFGPAAAVEPFGGKIIETNLNEDDVKAIKKAMKKA